MNTESKPRTPNIPIKITSLGHYIPEKSISNDDLVNMGSPVTSEWIANKTGIKNRHFADTNQALSDLVIAASINAFANSKIEPKEIDTVIVAGDNHDTGGVRLTSGIVAKSLGIKGASCLDIRSGCPASIVALHQGISLVASGLSEKILVCVGEINTRGIDFKDRTSVWFGDGGAAVILEKCNDEQSNFVEATYLVGEGNNSEILTIPAGGSREPISKKGIDEGRHHLFMDGRAVFPFAVEKMVETTEKLAKHVGIEVQELDFIFPHHANMRIIEQAMEILGLPIEKAYVNLEELGNTAGPSALIALSEAYHNGVVVKGQKVLIVGFGGGLAWGGQIIQF